LRKPSKWQDTGEGCQTLVPEYRAGTLQRQLISSNKSKALAPLLSSSFRNSRGGF